MHMFKWTLEFRCYVESPIVSILISLPFLPVHYMNCKLALFLLVVVAGKPLHVDHITGDLNRPYVARILVECDVVKTLLK